MVQWLPVPESDHYGLYLAMTDDSPPFALRTSTESSVLVDDLYPNTTYFFSLKSHPISEPTISWGPGWSDYSEIVRCTTKPPPREAPIALHREKELFSDHFWLGWMLPDICIEQGLNACTCQIEICSLNLRNSNCEWRSLAVQHESTQLHLLQDLESDSNFEVVVSCENLKRNKTNLKSDPYRFRTAGQEVMYSTMYRISEYSFEVDFLENHDAASVNAMPLYLMTCDPEGGCSPWDTKDTLPAGFDWDQCVV